MADLLQTASDWLHDRQKQHASRLVTYERGAATVAVQATIGRTIFEIDDEIGVVHKIESRDFLIHAADLVLSGSAVLPERGDRVRETDGTTTYIYEVMAPGKEPHYRYSDAYRKRFRIHTKQVEVQTT